jgi:hypothetical protein
MQYRVSDAIIWLQVKHALWRHDTMRCQRRTSHSSSSVQTSTPCLRISSGWKNVSDGLVAATCTDTSLYCRAATPRRVGNQKKRRESRRLWLVTYLEEFFDYERRFDGRHASCSNEKNVRVSFALVGRCGKLSCHGGVSVTSNRSNRPDQHELPVRPAIREASNLRSSTYTIS